MTNDKAKSEQPWWVRFLCGAGLHWCDHHYTPAGNGILTAVPGDYKRCRCCGRRWRYRPYTETWMEVSPHPAPAAEGGGR